MDEMVFFMEEVLFIVEEIDVMFVNEVGFEIFECEIIVLFDGNEV